MVKIFQVFALAIISFGLSIFSWILFSGNLDTSFHKSIASDIILNPPSIAIPQTLFGMHIKNLQRAPKILENIGCLRVFVPWLEIEEKNNQWNFSTLDNYVELAQESGLEVLFVFNDTPKWAAARPYEVSEFPEHPGAGSEPKDMQEWRDYVRTIATRYQGKIQSYQVWNEANNIKDYSGSIEKLVEMAKNAYEVLKSVDPKIQVVSPGPLVGFELKGNEKYLSLGGMDWLDNYFAQGGAKYTDVVGPHFYNNDLNPEGRLLLVNQVKTIMQKYGLQDKPLWDTESNFGNYNNPKLETEEINGYIARSHILYWASGVSRFYWYAWDLDSFDGEDSLRILEADNLNLSSTGDVYKRVGNLLVGNQLEFCKNDVNQIWICKLTNNVSDKWMVWNSKDNFSFKVPQDWEINSIVSLSGQKTQLPADRMMTVGQSPLFFE
ncbi:hypothetical protein IJ00_07290 [Calothrix sp. 336/3]|nr:hypothetical protein IJ00_07290 [Calothrix sp. 336/3]